MILRIIKYKIRVKVFKNERMEAEFYLYSFSIKFHQFVALKVRII